MKFTLPALPYNYNALEPHIDAQTMEIHHTKHHQAYIDNLNKALAEYPDLQTKTVEELVHNLEQIPKSIRTAVRNNGGGHANHSLFWQLLTPHTQGKPAGIIADTINKNFETFESMQEQFNTAAKSVFGSGWAWLVADNNKTLKIITTANQDSPLSVGIQPILELDVWEHAYYLQYQNKRASYIDAFWHIINWEKVLELYELATR